MASKRFSILRWSSARSGSSAMPLTSNGSSARVAPCSEESGLPVSFQTSSARWMRCASFGAIHRAQLGVQGRPAAARRVGVELGADARIGLRQRIEAGDQRAVVEHRAAHEQGYFLSLKNLHHFLDGILAPPARRIAPIGIDDVDQVVRHLRAQLGARLRGADVHAAVDQRRVERHDLERQFRRELDRERGFAARRWAEERVGARQASARRRRRAARR
jgi:hypothetical protein